uniref:LUD domain-containing protein n=1 Tax=Brachybacterium sp. GPGPB12 TaxID=3023517 RepID=UPI00404B2E49
MSTVQLGMPTVRPQHASPVSTLRGERGFPEAAREALGDATLSANMRHATSTIQGKRAGAVREVRDWQKLRSAGGALKWQVTDHLPEPLERLEESVATAGGVVHWARDAEEASEIVTRLTLERDAREVLKVKSMATQEIGLNEALAHAGIRAIESDLAELIVQLADDTPPTSWSPRSTATARRSARSSWRRCRISIRRSPTTRPSSRRRRAASCARSSWTCPARSRSAGRTSRSPRRARWWSWSPRATGGCA